MRSLPKVARVAKRSSAYSTASTTAVQRRKPADTGSAGRPRARALERPARRRPRGAHARDLELAALHQVDRAPRDLRVDPAARAVRQLRQRLAQGPLAAQRTRAGHLVERIRDVEDPALDWDLPPGQTVRVALAVEALVQVVH